MAYVHPIRTLQHLAKDECSENFAIDEIAMNLPRYSDRQIAEILIRASRFETTRSK
jgi:hypothetical protein